MAIRTSLVCPKCGGRMQPYERTGILVEECRECRGIFLDQGELERLIDAEGGGWSGRVTPPSHEPADAKPDARPARPPRRPAGGKRRGRTLPDLFGD